MKLETLEIGTQLKVIKDIYYVSDGSSLDNEFLTKDELFDQISHLCVAGDIYEVVKDEYGTWLECKEGKWKGESNDGWFDINDMFNKGVFEIVK